MKRTLVDTSHWVGAFTRRDKYKEIGKKFIDWFNEQDGEKSRIIITYSILTEVIASLLRKDKFMIAQKVLNFILKEEKIDIYNRSHEIETEIFDIFKQYEVLSLVDSETVVIYKITKCHQLLSTDNGFKRCLGIDVYKIPQ